MGSIGAYKLLQNSDVSKDGAAVTVVFADGTYKFHAQWLYCMLVRAGKEKVAAGSEKVLVQLQSIQIR